MPGTLPVERLEDQAARTIARTIIQCIVRSEKKEEAYFKLRSSSEETQVDPSTDADEPVDKQIQDLREEIDKDLTGLSSILENIPGLLLSYIHRSLLSEYTKVFKTLSHGDGVWFVAHGWEAKILLANMRAVGYGTQRSSAEIFLPKVRTVLNLVLIKKSIYVDLRPLADLGTMTETVFTNFKEFLIQSIPKMSNLITLKLPSPNNKTCLPQLENCHLRLIGENCPNLEVLDVSRNRLVTGEGIRSLGPSVEFKEGLEYLEHPGCVKLTRLLIFDTGAFEKDVAKLLLKLPNMQFLGYKETGKVIKTLHKNIDHPKLKLTHIDNTGCKTRKLVVTSLRCKKSIIVAISEMCPGVQNLKLRVADDDVMSLSCLERVESVELVYHVGSIQSPGVGTQFFLEARGSQLTSLTLICHNMTTLMISTVAANCVNLQQLWFRSNHFLAGAQSETLPVKHSWLSNLEILYLRIGLNELYVVHNLPDNLIPFLTRNAPLKEMILAIRSKTINDSFIKDLIKTNHLTGLEKLLLVVPGVNSIPGILDLTENTVEYVIKNCKNIKKLGNLLSWKIEREFFKRELRATIKESNWDLEIIDKRMTMR